MREGLQPGPETVSRVRRDALRARPERRARPAWRLRWAMGLGVAALGASLALGERFAVVAAVYFATMVAYSFLLKNVVILDVLIVAFGFVLRAVAGAVAIDVDFSSWLLVCTLLIRPIYL